MADEVASDTVRVKVPDDDSAIVTADGKQRAARIECADHSKAILKLRRDSLRVLHAITFVQHRAPTSGQSLCVLASSRAREVIGE